jgi:hypothetical protein
VRRGFRLIFFEDVKLQGATVFLTLKNGGQDQVLWDEKGEFIQQQWEYITGYINQI